MEKEPIMVVEDDALTGTLVKKLLSVEYSVALASTLTEAVEKIKEKSPDIVVLDLNLPDSKGLSTLRELQGKMNAKEIPNIPIVVMTGEGEHMVPAIFEGAQDALIKSMDTADDLQRIVRHAIVRHKVRGRFEPVKEEIHSALIKLNNLENDIMGRKPSKTDTPNPYGNETEVKP